MPANKPVPRFVPTLTEVVQPGTLSPAQAPAPAPAIDLEQLIQQAVQLAKPRLEQELRASLQAVVEQHMRTAAPRLQRDIEDAVRTAVAQTLAQGSQTQQ